MDTIERMEAVAEALKPQFPDEEIRVGYHLDFGEKEVRRDFSVRIGTVLGFNAFGMASTPEEAAKKAAAQYFEDMAAKRKRLKEDAIKAGFVVTEPEPEPVTITHNAN